MCYCTPEVRTPWCPHCPQAIQDELQKLMGLPKHKQHGKLIYVASPYGHTDKEVVQHRMEEVYGYMAFAMERGDHCITPLFMHEIVLRHEMPDDFDFWQAYCFNLLARCDEMHILCLKGWTESVGVTAEIEFCRANNIPIKNIEG
jgi:hypothetical protein